MKSPFLSGFYISGFETFMILLFFTAFTAGIVAIIAAIIRSTSWYSNSSYKHKYALSYVFPAGLLLIFALMLIVKVIRS